MLGYARRPGFRSIGGRARAAMVAAVCLVSACVIPLGEYGRSTGRRDFRRDRWALVELLGEPTTREQVLIHFGMPERTLGGERIFIYEWSRAEMIVHGFYCGGALLARYRVGIEFDEAGQVVYWAEDHVFPADVASPDAPEPFARWLDELQTPRD